MLLTSSRDSSSRIRSFLNELSYIIPDSFKINRGRQSLDDIFKRSRLYGASYIVIVSSSKGNPGRFLVYNTYTSIREFDIKIQGITLLKEIGGRESKIVSKKIRVGCIGELSNTLVKNLFMNLGYTGVENCESYVNGRYIEKINDKNIYEVKFLDAHNNIIGPTIRFLVDEGSNKY
ncbi:Brix domain-containing protein [Sulfolobus acidocaldarius]|uniref:Brix domain-containing protein n=1 Tax=Sulfolobus acidocaldarius TaxID=2285 RepID=UPI000A7B0441|nr:Brix domain-containing protein [Sulfolobus acidocaldarius]